VKGSIVESDEVQRLLMDAASEMRSLRSQVKDLQEKANAYDLIQQLRVLFPVKHGGMGVDVHWKLIDMAKRLAEPEEAPDATRN